MKKAVLGDLVPAIERLQSSKAKVAKALGEKWGEADLKPVVEVIWMHCRNPIVFTLSSLVLVTS